MSLIIMFEKRKKKEAHPMGLSLEISSENLDQLRNYLIKEKEVRGIKSSTIFEEMLVKMLDGVKGIGRPD